MHLMWNKSAVSHVVAALMLVTVAVGVAFVTYLFVMNYIGLTTVKSGKVIEIQSMNTADGILKVYVQNIGKETVSFDPARCIYINGILENCIMNKTTLARATLLYPLEFTYKE